MANHSTGCGPGVKRIGLVGAGSAALAAAFIGFSGGTATAEVEESAPQPYVTSRQALVVSENALRVAADGEARGFLETRLADAGIVHAQGEVGGQPTAAGGDRSDSVKAIPGSKAEAFYVTPKGVFEYRPPIGDW